MKCGNQNRSRPKSLVTKTRYNRECTDLWQCRQKPIELHFGVSASPNKVNCCTLSQAGKVKGTRPPSSLKKPKAGNLTSAAAAYPRSFAGRRPPRGRCFTLDGSPRHEVSPNTGSQILLIRNREQRSPKLKNAFFCRTGWDARRQDLGLGVAYEIVARSLPRRSPSEDRTPRHHAVRPQGRPHAWRDCRRTHRSRHRPERRHR